MACCDQERCCCGAVSVKTGTVAIGILTVIGGGLGVGAVALSIIGNVIFDYDVLSGFSEHVVALYLYFYGAYCLIVVMLGSSLVIGALNNNATVLIPYMVYMAMEIATTFLSVLVLGFMFLYPGGYMEQLVKHMPTIHENEEMNVYMLKNSFAITTVVCTIAILVDLWFFSTVSNCYKTLKKIQNKREEEESVAMLSTL